MNILLATFKALKFPVKLLVGWRRKIDSDILSERLKKPQKTELEQKCQQHVRNFAPTHYSWQKRGGKKLTVKQKEYYRRRRKKKVKNSKNILK